MLLNKIDENLLSSNLYQEALFVVKKLQKMNHQAFFIGGAIRDILLKKIPKEIDIATSATPDEINILFNVVHSVGAKFGVSVVSCVSQHYEVATFRKDLNYQDARHPDKVIFSDIFEDSKRRDFTMNSIYWNPINNEIHDFHNGIKDIEKKIIKTVGEPLLRFNEDRLRILRAIRFSAQLNFKINDELLNIIMDIENTFEGISTERIRDEIEKILMSQNPRKGFELLEKTNLLKLIFPELFALKGVEQPKNYHPEGDVWQHTMKALDVAVDSFPDRSKVLMWAVLLHDIAKPLTITYPDNEKDRIRFNKHDILGAKIAKKILQNFKQPVKLIENVCYIVKNHMKIGIADKIKKGRLKLIMSNFCFVEELALNYIDSLASHSDLAVWNFLNKEYSKFLNEQKLPDKIVTGNLLIELGYLPSPIFSKIIEKAYIDQLEGIFYDKEGAISYINKYWKNKI